MPCELSIDPHYQELQRELRNQIERETYTLHAKYERLLEMVRHKGTQLQALTELQSTTPVQSNSQTMQL